MSGRLALVTGAAGFIGSRVVRALLERGFRVRAGVHRAGDVGRLVEAAVEPVPFDVLDERSCASVLEGVNALYHFAAVTGPSPADRHFRVNAEGTRNLWRAAAACGVERGLYCSSAAVYGLAAGGVEPLSEHTVPRPFEPYGRSKLAGESAALEIGAATKLSTVVMRPVPVFGPGQSHSLGVALRGATFQDVFMVRSVRRRTFSFVHVEDAAEAAVHLLSAAGTRSQIFNVAVDRAVSFEEAFEAYLTALGSTGRSTLRVRILARASDLGLMLSAGSRWGARLAAKLGYSMWHPGQSMTYSAKKLLDTSFRFRWEGFEAVLSSSLGPIPASGSEEPE